MPYSVTSWFVDQAGSPTPPVTRKFLIGTSDYTDHVTKWPSISREWNDIRPMSVSISLANEDQLFNVFRSNKLNLRNTCKMQIGFTHPTSGDELINAFIGTVDRIALNGEGDVLLTVTDKLKQLSERVVGTSANPVTFSTSGTLPSDIAWTIVTSYGGFSNVQSTSNPDIDYTSFLAWAAVFSGDSVEMRGRFEGTNVLEALRKIGRHTYSAIFLKEDKLAFFRFTTINTQTVLLTDTHIKDLDISIEDSDILNKQWVYADYHPESSYWGITVADVKSASVNSYGLRERVEKDENIWYANSLSAVTLAQRMTNVAGQPYDRLTVRTPLIPLHLLIGETIQVVDSFLSVTEGWRIMKYNLSLDTGEMTFNIDASQINTPFILDVSALDGGDLLL